MYHYHNMLDELLETMKGFNTHDVTTFPAYKARVHLRNKLIKLGLDVDLANRATAALDVAVPVEFNEREDLMNLIFAITDEMAILITKFHSAAMKDFGSDEIFLKLLDGANLKIE